MTLLIALAFAEEPLPASSRVDHIVWAQPFTLQTPHPYRHTAVPRDIDRGWLVELRVDPTAMLARQIGVPGLWIGDDLAVRTNWDHLGGCAVVWVPGDHDLRNEPVFFGSTTLPERMDAERSALEHTAAREKGWGPVPVRTLETKPLALADLRGLMAIAADRIEACSTADDARLEALRAK
ncbi:MAG: hypothetical protein R3F61_08505 [Myxococcota bacterium]